jgi:hypothetical protein
MIKSSNDRETEASERAQDLIHEALHLITGGSNEALGEILNKKPYDGKDGSKENQKEGSEQLDQQIKENCNQSTFCGKGVAAQDGSSSLYTSHISFTRRAPLGDEPLGVSDAG